MRIVDVFCYNGEPIVAKRLEYLAPKVDVFVIVEARFMHSGLRKDTLHFHENAELFSKYNCRLVEVESFPPMPPGWEYARVCPWITPDTAEAWWREYYQREQALPVVRDLLNSGDGIALICDSDEIPSHAAIDTLVPNYRAFGEQPVHLLMDMFYYSFRWKFPAAVEPWLKAYALSAQYLRANPAGISLTGIRNSPARAVVEGGGWHCSYFTDAEGIRAKILANPDSRIAVPGDIQDIEDLVKTGKDVCGRDIVLEECTDPPPF